MDAEVNVWRRQERERLITLGMGTPSAARREWGRLINAKLTAFLTKRSGALGVFWPFRAEFDPLPLIKSLVAAGRIVNGVVLSNIAHGGLARTSLTGYGTSRSQKNAKSLSRRWFSRR